MSSLPAGRPTHEDVQAICSTFAEQMLEGLPGCERRDLTRLFPTASAAAADLLSKLLHFNPAKRITAEQVHCKQCKKILTSQSCL